MIVGLTGGMGSGKTTILRMFQALGADIYIADIEAKRLMTECSRLKHLIIDAFGEESYLNDKLNRGYLSKTVFTDSKKLALLNSFVHPIVHDHFLDFVSNSKAAYIVFESAILFQSKIIELCTYKIVVDAPLDIRIERVMQRDELSQTEIKQRIKHQYSSEEMMEKADFVIENKSLSDSQKKVLNLHNLILSKALNQ